MSPSLPILEEALTGGTNAFVTKIGTEGRELLFLGGSSYGSGSGIMVSAEEDIFVAGNTELKDFPVKKPFQKAYSDYPYSF